MCSEMPAWKFIVCGGCFPLYAVDVHVVYLTKISDDLHPFAARLLISLECVPYGRATKVKIAPAKVWDILQDNTTAELSGQFNDPSLNFSP